MKEKIYSTACGDIHYWVNEKQIKNKCTLIFLPGLTADHRLFNKQIEFFTNKYNLFVWDPPAHAKSWPFSFNFDLFDTAKWLKNIILKENILKPIIIGQSIGGYVGQVFMQQFKDSLFGFIAIDSAPLQKQYVTNAEIWLLKKMQPLYYYFPWKLLLKYGPAGCSTTAYGRNLMHSIMIVYNGAKKRYAAISGHGFKILSQAMQADLPYKISCPALLLCGEKDKAGSAKRYNKAWHKTAKIPLVWIIGAGHNSNTDNPVMVNHLIQNFIKKNNI